jgi:hypothetical protein
MNIDYQRVNAFTQFFTLFSSRLLGPFIAVMSWLTKKEKSSPDLIAGRVIRGVPP